MSSRPDVPANAGDSPALGPDWYLSRWGADDQRGNGNLMTPAKVLEAHPADQDRRDRQPRPAL